MKFGAFSSEDLIQSDGSTDPLLHIPMGKRRKAIAAHEQISRAEQDQYALDSHQKSLRRQPRRPFCRGDSAGDGQREAGRQRGPRG
ncbi:hypothetical protein LNP17_14225 [Klebsiella variicola subsp. variicola]|nr:hypothetical protein [Klebsiella variicola subsp. variicola]